ncbi:unnamed protein product [Gordionus sp. m RMFG-2023]|uniref:transmembrane 9 superfamily member 4-like n=1 Tax=Gordionus sp. m RMFG-2023 TaxID=3053472 RepID=UPI0030DE3089
MNNLLLSILIYYLHIILINSYYVPQTAPNIFQVGQDVPVTVSTINSIKTFLPYDYYSLSFCKPADGQIKYSKENLGELIIGGKIVNTPYKIQMKVDINCIKLCDPKKLSKTESSSMVEKISQAYFMTLFADNLPSLTKFIQEKSDDAFFEKGFKIGYINTDGKPYLFNHLNFTLRYYTDPETKNYMVVGFEVEPMSIDYQDMKVEKDGTCKLPDHQYNGQLIQENKNTELAFTYSVKWEPSDLRWASRWDSYLSSRDVKIHWFSIINSVVIIFLLSGILTMIIIRTLRKDIARYNREEDLEDTLEETGWKLVHGDVFRPPKFPVLFCALVGSGLQIAAMSLIVLCFAVLGVLSPASRGALMTAAIFLYVFMGMFAGYYSSRLYKTIKGTLWKKTAFYTATLYPSTVFNICSFLNFFLWAKHSSASIPFSTMMAILCLWFGISVPLVYIGSYFGYRKQPYSQPVRTNQIPRQIPEQPWYMNSFVSSLAAGVLPFGSTFIELFFIFTAIWENQFYYLFGFLFLVFLILVVSCGQISIVMVYFQLCNEDYRWWWKSFSVYGGGSALYMAGYALFYFFTKLEITGFVPVLLYLGYTAIMVLTFWLLTGVVGFFASYLFVKSIYSAVKID